MRGRLTSSRQWSLWPNLLNLQPTTSANPKNIGVVPMPADRTCCFPSSKTQGAMLKMRRASPAASLLPLKLTISYNSTRIWLLFLNLPRSAFVDAPKKPPPSSFPTEYALAPPPKAARTPLLQSKPTQPKLPWSPKPWRALFRACTSSRSSQFCLPAHWCVTSPATRVLRLSRSSVSVILW